MRVTISSILLLLCVLGSSCDPEKKCGGKLYYDPSVVACRKCPPDSTFKAGTCKCKSGYEFVDNHCSLMDGAVIETADAGMSIDATAGDAGGDAGEDAAMGGGTGPTCVDYCDFAKVCLGDNSLAVGVLPDVVSGLHADNKAACKTSCEKDLGGNGQSSAVVACIEAGRGKAACAGDSTQVGLLGAFTLIGDCCKPAPEDGLCKSLCKTFKANALASSQATFCP
jgi:hypothetical protein